VSGEETAFFRNLTEFILGREHLANIIASGGKFGLAGTITVRFGLELAALRVGIEGDAGPFNPLDMLALERERNFRFPRRWFSG
jgi:hypothetical protein